MLAHPHGQRHAVTRTSSNCRRNGLASGSPCSSIQRSSRSSSAVILRSSDCISDIALIQPGQRNVDLSTTFQLRFATSAVPDANNFNDFLVLAVTIDHAIRRNNNFPNVWIVLLWDLAAD